MFTVSEFEDLADLAELGHSSTNDITDLAVVGHSSTDDLTDLEVLGHSSTDDLTDLAELGHSSTWIIRCRELGGLIILETRRSVSKSILSLRDGQYFCRKWSKMDTTTMLTTMNNAENIARVSFVSIPEKKKKSIYEYVFGCSSKEWFNSSWPNDVIKPLLEPMLTFHQCSLVAFIWQEFENYTFKITTTSPRGQWVKKQMILSNL